MTERISPWKTSQLSALLDSWGPPTRQQQVAGRNYLIWNNTETSSSPNVGISIGIGGSRGGISLNQLFAGSDEENFCSRVVEINDADQIIGIQWSGKPSVCFDVTPEYPVLQATN
jgi:hypothetical protein